MNMVIKMQKSISILMVLAMAAIVIPVYATPAAENIVRITPQQSTIYQGSDANVSVNIEVENSLVANLSFFVLYNTDIFEVVDVNNDIELNDQLKSDFNLKPGVELDEYNKIGKVIVCGQKDVNYSITGAKTVATIRFVVKRNAPLGTYELDFDTEATQLIRMKEDNTPENIKPVNFQGATITVARRPGGSSGDSEAGKKYYEGNVTPSPSPSVSPSPSPSESPSQSPDGSADPRGASKFKDLKAQHEWARTAIDELVKRGIISGTSDDTFEPDREITRAEFCKLIASAFGFSDIDDTTSYSDVDKDAWYYSFVMAAAKAGLVTGYTEGDFRPNANITREEMAAILIRAFRAAGIPVPEGEMSFADTDEIGDWAAPFVAALVKMGIINGRDGNRFAPKDSLTRAETAKVTYSSLAFLEALLGGLGE